MFNRIKNFIVRYRYLIIILTGVFILVVLMLAGISPSSVQEPKPPDIEKLMKQDRYIAATKDMTAYQKNGIIYVEVRNLNMTDETLIRNSLKIDPSVPIVIYVPGASTANPYYRFDK